jgi:hypothetical protein
MELHPFAFVFNIKISTSRGGMVSNITVSYLLIRKKLKSHFALVLIITSLID